MKIKSKILFLLMITFCLLLGLNNSVDARTIYESSLKTSLGSISRELPATIDNLFYKVRILKPETTFKYFSTKGYTMRESVTEATRDTIKGWIDYAKTNSYPVVLADIHYDSAYSVSKTHATYGKATGYAYTTDSVLYDSNGSTTLIQKFSNSTVALSDITKIAKTNRTVELIDYSDNISVKFFGEKSNVQSKGAYIAKDRETGEILIISYEDIFVESNVRVEKDTFPLKSIKLSEEEISIKLGETGSLFLYVTPTNSTEVSNLRFNTSNKKVVDVVSSTMVAHGKYELAFKTVGEGTAYLEVYLKDSDKFREKCKVIVEKGDISVQRVTISSEDFELTVGDTYQLTATVEPDNATKKDVKWTTSNSNIATVSSTGKVTAKKEGTATITVKSVDGNKYDTCKVTVTKAKVPVEKVTLNKETLTLGLNDTYELTATVTPATATNQELKWTTSNSNIATVSNGKITAKKPGTATITVTSVDGNKKATCKVTVEDKISVQNVKINVETLKLKVGDTYNGFKATVEPSNATNKNVIWSSSDPRVVLAYSSGEIVAKAEGTAIITVKSIDGNKKAICTVTVEKNEIPVTSVSLNKDSLDLKIGETYDLVATVKPTNATNKNVKWYSSNINVVTVSDGKITAKTEGTATITVETLDGCYKDTCEVTVKKNDIPATSVTLNKDSLKLKIGETYTLEATVKPTNATYKEVRWVSSNSNIASVSNGKVKAIAKGTVTITVQTLEGNYKDTCEVTVESDEISVTGVTLNKDELGLKVGEEYTLLATVKPTNATNKDVKWTTSNSNIATVSSTGKITAKAEGTATITVETVDGSYKATCKVTVSKKAISVAEIVLDKDSLDLKIGETYTLKATVKPTDATNKDVKWYSNNNRVATVDQNGKIVAKAEGTAIITVVTEDGTLKDTCVVNVTDTEIKVRISEDWLVLEVDDIFQLTATVEPSNTKLKWKSSDEKVVTVNEKGVVTAVGKGRATITVATEDGKVKETCIVKVIDDSDDSPIQTVKYEITINYIINIAPGTDLAEFGNDIRANTNYKIITKDGKVLENTDNVGTGMTLKTENEEFTMIVKGDADGDGKITITDTVKADLYNLALKTPSEAEKMALDLNGDGKITITDTVKLELINLGLKEMQ